MTLTIELTPQQERRLKSLAEGKRVPVESIVEQFLTPLSVDIDNEEEEDEEWRELLAAIEEGKKQATEEDWDIMFAELNEIMGDVTPLPPDFSRADIYWDHD